MLSTFAGGEGVGGGDKEGVLLVGAFDGGDCFAIGSGYLVVSVCGMKEEKKNEDLFFRNPHDEVF